MASCGDAEKRTGFIPETGVQEALKLNEQIRLSEFLTGIEYVRLETTATGLVRPNSRVYLTDNHIITINSRQCLLFDRKSGDFLRELGRRGRGPGEYSVATSGFLNENRSEIYFLGSERSLICYSLDGSFVGTVKLPVTESSFGLGNLSYLNDSVYVLHHINATGVESTLISFFDKNGNVLGTVPNPHKTDEHPLTVVAGEVRFHHVKKKLLFADNYNDTVFQLEPGVISPHFIFNRGSACPTFESRFWDYERSINSSYIMHPFYLETEYYILGTFFVNQSRHFLFHNKKTGLSKISKLPDGLINDLDGSMPFEFTSVNNAGTEIACIIDAGEILAWLSSNKSKYDKISKEFMELENLTSNDNPVVIIGYVSTSSKGLYPR